MRKLTHQEISEQRVHPGEIHRVPRVPIYVLLDNIRSLYNVGSVFRTADGARISKLFLCGYTPHPPRKEIEKTALGATGTVPWEYIKNPMDVISRLKEQNIRICALEHTDRSVPYTTVTPELFPLCLIVGNEITGISAPILQQADMAIEIPMLGTKQSLNAAVAFGIAVYDFLRVLRTDQLRV
jgi:tRNA G18 (ribose-2'-O)-methylase SpoU